MGVQQRVKRLVESVVPRSIDFSGSRGIHAEEVAFYLMVFQRLFVFHTCRERVHGDKKAHGSRHNSPPLALFPPGLPALHSV